MDGDGAIGMREVKGEGGFTMVQAPSTAKFASMPQASIANDHVDLMLPPEMLAKHLNSFAPRFHSPDWRRLEQVYLPHQKKGCLSGSSASCEACRVLITGSTSRPRFDAASPAAC